MSARECYVLFFMVIFTIFVFFTHMSHTFCLFVVP